LHLRPRPISRIVLLLLIAVIAAGNLLYYPKWKNGGTEATLSWDVSGYYMYLPLAFLAGDLRDCSYGRELVATYGPTPDFQQGYIHEASGGCVMKYSLGQAVVLSPFFLLAHAYATASETYPADGFSRPYQLGISLGTLLIAAIGLIFLRRVLLRYFSDGVTALTLAALVLGTNYLNYAAIDGAMTHNTLFTVYALLLYTTIRFYERPDWGRGLAIGLLVGLAALTRPTEIVACLIPLLWGVGLGWADIRERFQLFIRHAGPLALAVIGCLAVGSLQLIYWKYVTGDWLVYSYQDQGFSWLRPHVFAATFSYRSGWLTYSPLMAFALIGFFFLYRYRPRLFPGVLIFCGLFTYITFAWDIWWYGGSLGQRAMVQSYPVYAFPLAAFFVWFARTQVRGKLVIGSVLLVFTYASLWFTHQAHRGGLLYVSEMTRPYYWATLFTYEEKLENRKLLDIVPKLPPEEITTPREIFRDTTTYALGGETEYLPVRSVRLDTLTGHYDWLRTSVLVEIPQKEWNVWRMPQYIVELYAKGELLDRDWYRMHRILEGGERRRITLDIRRHPRGADELRVHFWSAGSDKRMRIGDLRVSTFRE
jgi:hypothetical protein